MIGKKRHVMLLHLCNVLFCATFLKMLWIKTFYFL
uniref:Uncharacterized protein n=1 Tax=Anguilla anguilla TaxID=7936 RepID=A0A0E9PXV5_ANGAN